MKKLVFTLAIATLFAIVLSGCKHDLGTAPVLEDVYFSDGEPNYNRLTQIKIYETEEDFRNDSNPSKYTIVFKYTDPDLDVTQIQYSLDGVNYKSANYSQQKATETLYWDGWSFWIGKN